VIRFRDFLSPAQATPETVWQNVFISNILSLVLVFLSFSFLVAYTIFFGWGQTSYIIISGALSFFLVFVLLKRGYYNTGRVAFCLLPIAFSLVATVFSKHEAVDKTWLTYFDSRFVLLGCLVIPGLVFRPGERFLLYPCCGAYLLSLVFFDPIHNAFNAGFYQMGFNTPGYYYLNYIVFMSALFITLGVVALNRITERALQNKEVMNRQLKEQNEALFKQQEEITAGRDMLEQANRLISTQREELLKYNMKLEEMVEEKSSDLVDANAELINHNNELCQFSYTVSHNLRGPVARLLGLTNLFPSLKTDEERNRVLELLHQSTHDLDVVLKDLNFIIDIRNDIHRVRERVNFNDEWGKALRVLGDNMKEEFRVEAEFSPAPAIFGVKAMLQSIFYNLVSNSIKYRSPERDLIVKARSYENNRQQTVLEISDNGLGFDLQSHRDQVFKMYRRFHTHVSGKGIGLYLVKTQAEALNARIEIESELNRGTTFRLFFTTPPDLDKQVFFESDTARLYYDAYLNNTVIIWKKHITSEEYRKTFEAVLMTLKTYNTPGWIADLRNQGTVPAEDQVWFIENVLAEAVRLGLKRIGAVGFNDPVRKEYYQRMMEITGNAGVMLAVFETLEEATNWMLSFIKNQK